MATTVSFATDIKPLFNAQDISCMSGMGVELDSYTWMSDATGNHHNAANVYGHLTGKMQPQMPLGAAPWDNTKIDLFKSWMDGGYQP